MSVTTLTGKLGAAGIAKWRKSVGDAYADKISNEAKDRGTLLHETIETYLRNTMPDLRDISNKALFNKVARLLDKVDDIQVLEGTLYSDDLKLAGTTDCIANYMGELSVIDFKTSTKPKLREYIDNYFMQGGAYGRMYEELTGVAPVNVVIMVAVEQSPVPQMFFESYPKCHKMLLDFMRTLQS